MDSTEHKRLVMQYYSSRAKDYDRQKRRTWGSDHGFGIEVTEQLLEALASYDGKAMLEVGVGTGRNAAVLFGKIKPWFVGLDLSKEMLELAKTRTSAFKQHVDLILGDAEYLPFADFAFDAIICMSVMHYFPSQTEALMALLKALKKEGTFIYGDLTAHELDDQRFLETLENTLCRAHARYCNPSEINRLLESCDFRVSRAKIIKYQKLFSSLMDDKGQYFGVTQEMLQENIKQAATDAKSQYSLTEAGLTMFYIMLIAFKRD